MIDTLVVPDTHERRDGPARSSAGTDLAKVDLPLAGNGILALGVSMVADQPTGMRIGAARAGNGATFTSYVTVNVEDTTTSIRKQALALTPHLQHLRHPDPAPARPGGS